MTKIAKRYHIDLAQNLHIQKRAKKEKVTESEIVRRLIDADRINGTKGGRPKN